MAVIELYAGNTRCTVSPDDGGRLASLHVGTQQVLVERAGVTEGETDPMSWGCYPMAPWAGRVRRGQFTFRGTNHALPINLAPHSIHGTVFNRSWHLDLVEDHQGQHVTASLSCDFGPQWPFGGFASQRITLSPGQLECVLAVTAGDQAMPAHIGWHPWFVKPNSADLHFERMFVRDHDGIPTGALVTPPPGPWDDCFVEPLAPIALHYDAVTVTVASDCAHWVVYDQPAHATCVEPQSGPPDAFSLGPDVLEAGQTLQRTMTLRWS